MKINYTPRPWIQVRHWVEHLKRTEAETIANARLIAAAPDMLEALKLIQNQDLVLPAER